MSTEKTIKQIFTKPFFSIHIALVTLIFISLTIYAAPDIRGTDQYWYVDDVNTLVHGGPGITNSLYPTQVIREKPQIPSPFMHNILPLYLVVPAAAVFGSFKGWIITNLIASIAAAAILAMLVYKIAGRNAAILSYAIYLLLPLTLWQTTQPLAEAIITLFIAMLVFAFVFTQGDKLRHWLPITFAACAAYYCRQSYILLLLIVPVLYVLRNKPVRTRTLLCASGFMVFIVMAVLVKKMLFVEAMPGSLTKVLNNAIPGLTRNMHFLFSLEPEKITFVKLWTKSVAYIKYQFFPPVTYLQIFYLPFNLLVAATVYLAIKRKTSEEIRSANIAVFVLLIHMATIIIHQNQFRYLMTATPPVLVAASIVLSKTRLLKTNLVAGAFVLIVIACLCAANVPIVTKLRTEALQQREQREQLASIFESTIRPDETVIVDIEKSYNLMLGYVLKPRTVLYLKTGYRTDQYQQLIQKTNAKWLICPIDSPLRSNLKLIKPPVLRELSPSHSDYALFRLSLLNSPP